MKSHECAPTVKKCSSCGEVKPLNQYYRRTDTKSVKADCKICYNVKQKAGYEKHKFQKLSKCAEYRKENKERITRYMREWYQLNKKHVLKRSAEYNRRPEVMERQKIRSHDYYAERSAVIQARRKIRLESNPDVKKRQRDYEKQYAKLNKGIWNAKSNRRRAKRLKATPKWVDWKAVREFYLKAAELTAKTGIRHVVDHKIPLQGKNVCGLHVENNLCVITEKENLEKFNKFNG